VKGILAMGATNSFIGANFVLGQANLVYPDFEIQRWHTVLLAYLFTVLATVINLWGPRLLNKISKAGLIINFVTFIAIIIILAICNPNKQPVSFVFQDFQNLTGFGTAMAGIIGILQPAYGMCCSESPAHMSEEMKDASREAPKAIVLSVYIGAITGFIFLVTVCFCIGNIEAVAGTSTGVPLIQIFFDSTNSNLAACMLASLIALIDFGSGIALLAGGSRVLYAFARDRGLPFSGIISKIEPTYKVPVTAILLASITQMALNSFYLGTVTGFNTIIAIATEGYYLSYAMALLARIMSYFNSTWKELTNPWAMQSLVSLAVNTIGVMYLLFACITFNFPSVYPVTTSNMNYTSAAIGAVMLMAAATWITSAHKQFSGPELQPSATPVMDVPVANTILRSSSGSDSSSDLASS
jgi:choline transport protein